MKPMPVIAGADVVIVVLAAFGGFLLFSGSDKTDEAETSGSAPGECSQAQNLSPAGAQSPVIAGRESGSQEAGRSRPKPRPNLGFWLLRRYRGHGGNGDLIPGASLRRQSGEPALGRWGPERPGTIRVGIAGEHRKRRRGNGPGLVVPAVGGRRYHSGRAGGPGPRSGQPVVAARPGH